MSGEMIGLTIDGHQVWARQGSTILEAAHQGGVTIPHLCAAARLSPAEACRLCLVEVEGQARPLAACATPISAGMEVVTRAPHLERERQAIFRLLLQDHYGDCLPPCSQRCPANIDIQGYIALIARGRFVEATQLIRMSNPLPLTCGRVCPHPCESQCRRGRVDQPVAINHLKRFCSDIAYQDLERLNPAPAPPSGKKVAVVGGGPAGLTAAYYLALLGHAPTIWESNPQLGGMLRYGIPEYRLPKAVLDREIEAILRLGVEVKTDLIWGRDFSLADLSSQGFDAIFLGTGASVNRELNFIPEGTSGVNYGTCFLGQVALGQETGLAGRVAVIGGGNTAMDCARTALRLGASEVMVYYRRSRKEMPAQDIEVEEASEEGVGFEFLVAPVAVRVEEGRLTGMTLVRMDLCEADGSGRARPQACEGSEFEVPIDYLVVAVGQTADLETLGKDPQAAALAMTKWRTVQGDYLTGRTSQEGIFAGGDLTSGPATVVEAIGAARRAATAIDRYLRGQNPRPARPFVFSKGTLQQVDQANFQGRPSQLRVEMPVRPALERRGDFGQVDLGLDQESAQAEAQRCLSCGCQAVHDCLLRETAQELGLEPLLVQETAPPGWGIRGEHPHLLIEDAKCIVCQRCERACQEWHGRGAVRVVLEPAEELARFRGHRVEINQDCDSCGLCASVCPTGSLSPKGPWSKPGPLPATWAESLCDLCPLGCRLSVGSLGGHLVAIEGAEAPPAWGHLCRRGRFDLAAAREAPSRLASPLLRREGELGPASWDQALEQAARSLGRLKAGGEEAPLAGLVLGRGSVEELYLFGKLVRAGLGVNHLDFMAPDQEDPAGARLLAGLPRRSGRLDYGGLEERDLVLVVSRRLSGRIPLLESALHRMIRAGGSLLLMGRDPVLASRAVHNQDLAPTPALEAAARLLAGSDGPDQARELLKNASRGLLLVDETCLAPDNHEAWDRLREAAAKRGLDLALAPSLPALWSLRLAGIGPDHYPGHHVQDQRTRALMEAACGGSLPRAPGWGVEQILERARQGSLKGLVILAGSLLPGEPLSRALMEAATGVEHLVVLAACRTLLVEQAQVVLPLPLPLENQGLYLNGEGNPFSVTAALPLPPGLRPAWRVLAQLHQALGGPPLPDDLAGVRQEWEDLQRALAGE